MAVRKRRSTKVKRKRRPSTVRPISKTSPKGKIALLMLDGSHTYAAMAKKTRTTIHNIYKHGGAKGAWAQDQRQEWGREVAGVGEEGVRF